MAECKARKTSNQARHAVITRVLGAAVLLGAGASPMLISTAANAAVVPPPPGAIVVGTASRTCPNPSFSTIQAAVTAAAANSTIYVCAGTYDETVTITKNLTLLGAQWGVPAANRVNPTTETIVTSPTSAFTYSGAATTGIINGFDIQGTEGTQNGIVVLTNAGTGFTWINNIINDDGNGINFHSTGTTPTTITGNRITDNTASGGGVFFASGPASHVTISNNNFAGNSAAINTTGAGTSEGPLSQYINIQYNVSVNDGNFVVLFLAQFVQITHNRISWTNPFSTSAGSAIYISGGNNAVGVGQNLISGGSADGVNINNAFYTPSSDIAITWNTITLRLDGIHIAPSSIEETQTASGVVIAANTVQAAGLGDMVADASDGGNGIWIQGSTGTQVSGNAAGNSLFTDCRDETTGSGTLGTASTWTGNFGMTSFPAGLCSLPLGMP